MARSVVGIWTKRMPRMLGRRGGKHSYTGNVNVNESEREEWNENAQCCGDEACEVTDDAASESEEDGVARTFVMKQHVFDICFCLSALTRLAWRDDVDQEASVRSSASTCT